MKRILILLVAALGISIAANAQSRALGPAPTLRGLEAGLFPHA